MASWLLRAQWAHRDESIEERALRVDRTLTAVAVAFPEVHAWTQDERWGYHVLEADGSTPLADMVEATTKILSNGSSTTRLHLQSTGELPWLFDLSMGNTLTTASDQLTLHWSDDDALTESERFAQVLRAVVSIWEPDWASIADTELATAAGLFRRGIPTMGWLTYIRGLVAGAYGIDIDLTPFERGTLLQAPVSPADLLPVHICAAAALVGITPEDSNS
ncbi:hypothetical protein FB561_7069 [Kribbella amoyensis]|uniref:Uncharacterized protein n=1 Tax=Kribbella amoyensis TaxID=996641 RepID=A0A561B2W4_9ACTN|nr:hypothetical protein [Kribbella amoyensis]TWD73184.1 hypothetical protein FB561_7069 [Kribbella amoyensis]